MLSLIGVHRVGQALKCKTYCEFWSIRRPFLCLHTLIRVIITRSLSSILINASLCSQAWETLILFDLIVKLDVSLNVCFKLSCSDCPLMTGTELFIRFTFLFCSCSKKISKLKSSLRRVEPVSSSRASRYETLKTSKHNPKQYTSSEMGSQKPSSPDNIHQTHPQLQQPQINSKYCQSSAKT